MSYFQQLRRQMLPTPDLICANFPNFGCLREPTCQYRSRLTWFPFHFEAQPSLTRMKVLSECVFLIGGFYDDWLAFMSLNPKAASTTYMAKISQKEPSQNSLILTPPDLGIFLTLRAFYFLGNFSCLNFYIQGHWSRLIDVIWGRGEIAMTEWLTEVLFKTVTSQ